MNPEMHILGGGPAGLAVAYYAHKRGLKTRVYEAGPEAGGNCRTLTLGEFRFDTGAHRVHAKDPDVTREIRELLGDALLEVDAPSRIVFNGKRLLFPLAPRDLLGALNARQLLRVARELLLKKRSVGQSFQDMAVNRYGETLAGMFLLNYTRKLWGRDPALLSPAVAGGRLSGLDARTFLIDQLSRMLGMKARTNRHLDGAFLYPASGIGSLFDAVQERLSESTVELDQRVSRIHHDGMEILGVTLNDSRYVATKRVVSTLPLPLFLRALDPPPPPEILDLAAGVAYRNLVLCVLCLDQERYSENASLYFPDPEVPFTRLYEPRNRSPLMAPPGKTCIVLELPCDPGDAVWTASDAALITRVVPHLSIAGEKPPHLLNAAVYRVAHAYPVLERGIEPRIKTLLDYCNGFGNLQLTGRNAVFQYAHIHDMFRTGREVAES